MKLEIARRPAPDRSMIDEITTHHPCLLNNFNATLFLANTAALQAADLEQAALREAGIVEIHDIATRKAVESLNGKMSLLK
jgi:predicted amidohydrolase YtcJ